MRSLVRRSLIREIRIIGLRWLIIAYRTVCWDFLDRSEAPITFETLLEPLETTDRAIGLVLELRLELGNPDHICDRANEGDEWDQPPDQGRERSRFGGSKNDPESHHGCGEHAVRLCDGSRTFASIHFSCHFFSLSLATFLITSLATASSQAREMRLLALTEYSRRLVG